VDFTGLMRLGWARHGSARLGLVWQGLAGQGVAWSGTVRHGMAWGSPPGLPFFFQNPKHNSFILERSTSIYGNLGKIPNS
jgi:hypothetical protein